MNVVKKNTTTESMQKDAPNQMGGYKVDMNGKSQECICRQVCQVVSEIWVKIEPKLSYYLPNYLSLTL